MVVEAIPKMTGMIYAIIGFFILVVLFYKNRFNRKIGYLFIVTSTIVGFLVFAPMFPNQFQLLILGKVWENQVAVVGFLLFIVLTFVFGRIFCGYLCPIGAIQELVYSAPVRKLRITSKTLPVHLLFFIVFLFFGLVFSVGILTYLGFRDFFYLNITSPFFYVFLVLLVISAVIYRPFCRFFCPYGVLLSLASARSLFKLRRNDSCINCKKCERACPTNEADGDAKLECYLCNRCVDACPVNAIEYVRNDFLSKIVRCVKNDSDRG